jgi:hypothetical protein
MFRFTQLQRRLLLGVLVGALMLGGSVIQPGETLAGFSTSPGTRDQSSHLMKACSSGNHLREVVIELS